MTISLEASALQVTLLPSLPTSTVGQPLLLQMQIHNPTTSTQRFCTYHTLVEGVRNNLFTVTAEGGDTVDYAGMMAKRAPPGPADFRDIEAGATIVSDAVDLADGYTLGAGRFTIVFDGNAISGLSPSAPTVVERRAP
jgi:hypothetical protein